MTLANEPQLHAGADLSSVRGPVERALPEVERAIAECLDALPATLRAACIRMASAGGRRLRARLVLTAAQAAGKDADPTAPGPVAAAAAIELVHLASLVHDDLLDAAPTRRGADTINAVEGPAAALLAGNCLQAAAMGCAARIGADAVTLLQAAVVDLCAGAALEQENRYRADVGARDVLAVARLKAGTLLSAACRLGALAAPGADDGAVAALGEYGRLLGTALQLLDDLLDVTSSPALLGKPVESDFANGIVTLPALPALAADPLLRSLLRPDLSPHERRYAMTSIRQGGGVDRTHRAAVRHIARARMLCTGRALPPTAAAESLAAVPHRFLSTQLSLVDPTHRPLFSSLG